MINNQGFTLLEVLISLFCIASLITAMLTQQQQNNLQLTALYLQFVHFHELTNTAEHG